ncbi:Isoamylase 1, chloroplastic [Glycine max]|nr:Isoamylase 1, chloroplastic [Glycine max]
MQKAETDTSYCSYFLSLVVISLWDGANAFGAPIEGDLLTTGAPLSSPPLIDLISNDPILCGVKLIAEAWDAGGLYQVGIFPHWGIWSEWNGKYRDTVRQFIKGTDGFAGAFAECLCGSPNLYQGYLPSHGGGRKPWHSINFICAHDGFTLADLVTYNNKNNLSNGEDNNDGENHNNSWNCGQEGEFVSTSVKKLRKPQMRNFFLCLMVSQLNYFRWDKKEESSSDFFRFCRLMTKFHRVTLPDCPGYRWEPLVDTSKPSPYDFLTPDLPGRDIAIQQYAQFLDANMYEPGVWAPSGKPPVATLFLLATKSISNREPPFGCFADF